MNGSRKSLSTRTINKNNKWQQEIPDNQNQLFQKQITVPGMPVEAT